MYYYSPPISGCSYYLTEEQDTALECITDDTWTYKCEALLPIHGLTLDAMQFMIPKYGSDWYWVAAVRGLTEEQSLSDLHNHLEVTHCKLDGSETTSVELKTKHIYRTKWGRDRGKESQDTSVIVFESYKSSALPDGTYCATTTFWQNDEPYPIPQTVVVEVSGDAATVSKPSEGACTCSQ
jgi:hypothetical protein